MTHRTILPTDEERRLPEFNAMQRVKRRFFAMRNGDLAQQMADRGVRYRINFGLNLPQISEIARDFLPGGTEYEELQPMDMAGFARRLRDNSTTRESMLIAPMLFPAGSLTQEEAEDWVKSLPTTEIADVLCLKLLRNWSGAAALAQRLSEKTPSDLIDYCLMRLVLNLLQSGRISPDCAAAYLAAGELRATPLTLPLRRQLSDEIAFLQE